MVPHRHFSLHFFLLSRCLRQFSTVPSSGGQKYRESLVEPLLGIERLYLLVGQFKRLAVLWH